MTPRDDHPRDRQRARLERKQGRRQPGRRFLVVCEGKKTEPNYLKEMRDSMRIHAANLHVVHRHVALAQVREHLPDYDKGMEWLFTRTKEHLPVALERAYRMADRYDPRADGPWTGMHLLVHLLLDEGLELPKFPAPFRGDPGRISEVSKRLGVATQA